MISVGLPKSAAQKSQDYVIFPQNSVSSDLSLDCVRSSIPKILTSELWPKLIF